LKNVVKKMLRFERILDVVERHQKNRLVVQPWRRMSA